MMLRKQIMSNFRAINQPPDSPLKPNSREQPLHHAVSRQKLRTEQGQTLARPSVIVPLPEKQSRRHSQDQGDLRRAISKAERTSQKPKKKKKSSAFSTTKPTRQQAAREKKVVPSIEKSPNTENGSSTPESGIEAADDSDFVPSPEKLAELHPSSASSTPSRRSPHTCQSKFPNAGLSPKAASAPAVSKRVNSPTLTSTATPKLISPLRWSSSLRQKEIEKEGVAEISKERYECARLRKELAKLEKIMIDAEKRETEKPLEQRSVKETYGFDKKTKKRRPEKEVEQSEPHKRQKSRKSRKPRLESHHITDESRTFNEEDHLSDQVSSLRSPKGKTKVKEQKIEGVEDKAKDPAEITGVCNDAGVETKGRSFEGSKKDKAQCSFDTSVKSQDYLLPAKPSGQSRSQARNNGRQKRSLNEGWSEQFKRREISVPETFQPCNCQLPEYFTRNPSRVPHFASWRERGGGELEFLEHVMQISSCQGSNHPKRVVDACGRILKEHRYPEWWYNDPAEPVSKSAREISATKGTNDSDSRRGMRAQSSIAPRVFYGNKSGDPPTTDTGSSSCTIVQPSKEFTNGCTQSKTQPVRNQDQIATSHDCSLVDQPSNSTVPTGPRNYLTPPNSSPLGQRRKTGISSQHRQFDDSAVGQENVGVKPMSKTLPDVSSELDRPQIPFNIQRQRYQSVPTNLPSRNTTGNKPEHLPLSTSQKSNNALQEITGNALLRNLVRKLVVEEFQAARTPPQIAAVQPAQAAPTATATAPGGGDGTEPPPPPPPPPVSRKRKRPSRAEQQLRKPKLDRNVPPHARLSDEQIIEVGRRTVPYERHSGAPQAFNWSGHLYADHKYLIGLMVDGVLAWTEDEIHRVVG